MTDVKISVATVALNAARDLPLTIESIAGQTYANVEYIVVDGCSSDDSVRILERYSDVIDKLVFVEDSGIYDAMHTAVANATGDYIIFINAGDRFYSEDILQNVVSRIVGSPDILYGNHIYKDGGLEYFKSSMDFRTIRERLLYGEIDSRWHDRIPGHQATFVKPSLFKSLDFDSTFDICADHDFLFRAYDAGAEMQYVDEIISFYMAGGFSSRNAAKLRREWALAYRRCSLVPGAVDSFIFNKERSPFPPYTAFSGYIVSGKHEWEGPLHEDDFIGFACWASVLEIISPSQLSTTGMQIKGRNLFPDQEICLIHDGVRIASVSVPVGEFDISLSFSRILPRGSHVILRS